MPDWLAHVLFAYILCRILGVKFEMFNSRNTAIVMVGSLIPDVVKIGMIFDLFGIEIWDFIAPLHTPICSLLVAGLVSLLFYDLRVFLLLILGFTTHYMLDFLMGHVSSGMLLLFPFSWNGYQLGLIHCDDYMITLVLVVLAVIVYPVTERFSNS